MAQKTRLRVRKIIEEQNYVPSGYSYEDFQISVSALLHRRVGALVMLGSIYTV